MGWADIKDRMVEPFMTDEGINKIIDNYLYTSKIVNGKFEISRALIMDDYIEPAEDNFKTQEEFDEYVISRMFEVIRYALQSSLITGKKVKSLNPEESKIILNLNDSDFYDIMSLLNEREKEINKIKVVFKGKKEIIEEKEKEIKERCAEEIKSKYSLSKDAIRSLEQMFDNLHIKLNGTYGIEDACYFYGANKDLTKSTTRFYMNRNYKNKESWNFIVEFMKMCIDKDITASIKPTGAGDSIIDSLILYGTDKSRDVIIDFLQSYIKEHPEEMSLFGSPIATGENVIQDDGRSYYAATRVDGKQGYLKRVIRGELYPYATGSTYNYYFNVISQAAFASSCYKILEKYSPSLTKDFSIFNSPININGGAAKLIDLNAKEIQPIIPIINKIIEENPTAKSELMKEYKDTLKKINSLYTFGDLDHLDVPISFDEKLYNLNVKEENKEETKDVLLYVKGYSDFIYNNWLSCSILKEYKDLPKEVVDIFVKVARNGTDSLTEIDIKNITEMDVKYKLLKVVKAYVEKRPAKKEEFHNTVAKIFESNKKEKKEISAKTLQMYARLRLIEKYRAHGIGIILFNKLPEEKRNIINNLISIKNLSELEEELNKLDSSNITYDIWAMSQTIISKMGDKAKEDYDSLRGATSRKM